ncbi:hypothetical protein UFOVP694_49 [uncultured Caudovirales phage]|uniref:Uncharacterized protein n=1 Tax=uncultured Caudovirales phage TaxID=2100421 RepID=A0A6J5NGF8_9CAUD|nr:hypothetical protein UFOVP694_49 [uncultured Caudovirales phage]
MATVDKAFRIKNGLVVEGATATVNGSSVLTEASTEFLQDTTAAMFTGGSSTGISFSYNDTTGVIDATVSADPIFGDKITFEGTTPDAYELTLQVVDPTQDVTVTLPNATDTLVGKATTDTLTNKSISGATNTLSNIGNASLTNSAVTVNGTSISLGSSGTVTANTTNALTIGTGLSGTSFNGSAAVTVAIDSTVATTSGTQTLTNKTLTSPVVTGLTLNDSSIVFEGSSADAHETTLTVTNPTEDRTITLPNVSGTVVTTGDTGSVTNTMLAGSIANEKLTNSSITINGTATALGGSINITSGVSSVSGTTNQIAVSATTGDITLSLPSTVTFPGTVTLNADPTQALQAATKQYVDAVAQGLNVHASCIAATTANVNLANALEAGDIIDGVTLVAGDRVLVKNQSTASQNGIYVVQATGAAVRATDFDTPTEIVPGDFVFVSGGTNYDNTGWVQTDKVTTVGTDPINFTQFSGAGTYQAGNGLTLTGNSFSINTGVTVDINTAQTLTNKTLTSPSITNPTVSGLYLSDNSIVIEGTNDVHETTLTFTDPTQDNTVTVKNASGTLAFTTDIESAVDAFGAAVTGGTAISASYANTSNILTITNTGVTGLTGTTDQVTVSASTGSVTLSLPQSIAATSSPTFAALSIGSGTLTAGSVTLADALIGSATTSVTTTSATVVDTWSTTTYDTAKYIVQMKNGNDIEAIEVLVTVDGNNNVYITEYADLISNAQLGTIDADYLSGNARLLVTSTNGTTVKVHKTLIEA